MERDKLITIRRCQYNKRVYLVNITSRVMWKEVEGEERERAESTCM